MSYARIASTYDASAPLQSRAEKLIAMHTALYLQGGFPDEVAEEQCLALTMALVDPYISSYNPATADPAVHRIIVELMRVASHGYHLPPDDPWYPFVNG